MDEHKMFKCTTCKSSCSEDVSFCCNICREHICSSCTLYSNGGKVGWICEKCSDIIVDNWNKNLGLQKNKRS